MVAVATVSVGARFIGLPARRRYLAVLRGLTSAYSPARIDAPYGLTRSSHTDPRWNSDAVRQSACTPPAPSDPTLAPADAEAVNRFSPDIESGVTQIRRKEMKLRYASIGHAASAAAIGLAPIAAAAACAAEPGKCPVTVTPGQPHRAAQNQQPFGGDHALLAHHYR
jgi:hypothetical protein